MEDEMARARRMVDEARERVDNQRALIEGLRRTNHHAADAESLLKRYEAELADAEAYLDRVSRGAA